jgi:dolichol kinase
LTLADTTHYDRSPPLPVPLPPSRGSVAGRRAATRETHLASPIPTLLPIRIGLSGHDRTDAKGKGRGWLGFRLTRRRCEDGLLLGAVMLGVWKLGAEWEERALAGGEWLEFR